MYFERVITPWYVRYDWSVITGFSGRVFSGVGHLNRPKKEFLPIKMGIAFACGFRHSRHAHLFKAQIFLFFLTVSTLHEVLFILQNIK